MKILFVGNFYRNKGTQNIGSKILECMDKQAYQTSFIWFSKNPFLRFAQLVKGMFTLQYDIVHLETYSGRYFNYTVTWAVKIAKLRGKKVILNMQGGALPEFHAKNPGKVIKYLKRGDLRVSPSQRIIDYFAKDIKIEYLPSFIDLSKFPYDFYEERNDKLLWVRAFKDIYNPWLAIEALKILKEKHPTLDLTMVGPDAGLMDDCKKLAQKYNLQNRVTFPGPVNNAELYKYFNSHSVYLNTTSFESFGFALVEAASCGIPIVSSKVGEIPYIWQADTEIKFFSDKSAEELAAQIELLITNAPLRKEISKRAKTKAETFTWEAFSSKFYSLLKQLN
ncbi:MAG TPA: glycosyltransferase family 4 protein [Bacteroidia bacterium]|nr:glycosyltransferase family 4 protein [Bacteroidia bacterium]